MKEQKIWEGKTKKEKEINRKKEVGEARGLKNESKRGQCSLSVTRPFSQSDSQPKQVSLSVKASVAKRRQLSTGAREPITFVTISRSFESKF